MPKRKQARRPPLGQGGGRVRYAVVGLGWIAQSAYLPAFAGATKNSELAALVSDDAEKLRALGRKYKVPALYSYEEFHRCLAQGDVDAVVIALPNTLHRAYAEAAANAGVHVLCEKPMAMDETDCMAMIEACRGASVKLMVGYRLHFEKANLEAVALVRSGQLGEPRVFHAFLTQDVEPGNVRLLHRFTRAGRTRTRVFPAREQFGPELVYFSDCILKNREPEPSGEEGLADVRILRAVERSTEAGGHVKLAPFLRERRPLPAQEIRRPLREKPTLVHVQEPTPSD